MTRNSRQSGQALDQLGDALFSSNIMLPVLEEINGWTDGEFWVGAGAVAQTVWNHRTRRPCEYGINDIDVVYFDADDHGVETEKRIERELTATLTGIGIPFDVKNQARVHTWHRQKFGCDTSPYGSLREAIETWPTTATAVAVRLNREKEKLEVVAPFGLADLLSLTVRPNRTQITKDIYEKYRGRWQGHWPELKILEWDPWRSESSGRLPGAGNTANLNADG